MSDLNALRGAPLPIIPQSPSPPALVGAPLAQAQDANPEIRQAAEEFESMFLSEMMAPMFESLDTEGLGGGGLGEQIFRPMLVEQYAKAIAHSGGVGLADSIVSELNRLQAATAAPIEGRQMALIADTPADRVEQLILLSERLAALVAAETARIEARDPPLDGADAEEKNRLANAYRLELARIKQDPSLIEGAPPALLAELRVETERLHVILADHEIALGAVKIIAEGLVQAMAEEIARQRGGAQHYGASGQLAAPSTPSSAVVDHSA